MRGVHVAELNVNVFSRNTLTALVTNLKTTEEEGELPFMGRSHILPAKCSVRTKVLVRLFIPSVSSHSHGKRTRGYR